MSFKEKYESFITYAGCEAKIQAYDRIVANLKESKLKNIAVLGGAGSGKTALINRLSGKEVRKVTALSFGETPLMVTFGSEERKEGFEKVDVADASEEKKGIAFYEIPETIAFEEESTIVGPLLEEMDAVIYIISANMPFTSSDKKNLSSIVNRFPVLLYISRTDCLESEEYEECISYIRDRFAEEYEGVYCEIYDGKTPDYEKAIWEKLGELDLEGIREFHVLQLEYAAKELISAKLYAMLAELSEKRERRNEEKLKADSLSRDKELAWNDIRIGILEKEQETLVYSSKMVEESMLAAKKELLSELDGTANKKIWVEEELKKHLEARINKAATEISNIMYEQIDAHTAWLISAVNRKFDKRIQVEDVKRGIQSINSSVGACKEAPANKKILMAIGSGIVAGGVVFSSIPLLPTCIVAVPASIFAARCIKDSMEEEKKYKEYVVHFVEQCCESNFKKLKEHLQTMTKDYYAKMVSIILQMSEDKKDAVDFKDIDDMETAIKNKIRELTDM